MVEKIKNKLNKLHQRKIFLEDQHVIKIDIEISILEEILES